ncbi:MAG: isopentenyl-diphosphate Delta-isomerase [Candidatus Taylorbacteria bacterium]|nr:isopentenyl-diphosphate Delta-isomerase [Candidatus Taylorbacteria bacterium]
MANEIILVDEKDNEIGVAEKLKAHLQGKLHRCFSILIFNSRGETLLQKRAKGKYHSGELWSNACCSHPRPGEDIKKEAEKRLKEEMGIESDLKEVLSFIYKANLGDLTEHEFDHVFVGKFDGDPKINLKEADDWQWVAIQTLKEDVKENPQNYTIWFKLILEKWHDAFSKL